MDRRTVLFIIAVSLAFLGINLFFSQQTDKKNRELLREKQQKEAQAKALFAERIKERQVPIQDLPLVEIYDSPIGEKVITKGIDVKGSTLVMAWSSKLPQTIYVNGVKQNLLTKEIVQGGPALYGSPTFTSLDLASLPQQGSFELQLITFALSEPYVTSHTALYHNGELELFSQIPSNALALYKGNDGYLPFGFYEYQGRVFLPLQELPTLTDVISQPQDQKSFTSLEAKQSYYVLENETQQLVFTNIGGSLAEINLPFATNENSMSVIKEIDFDRQMVEESPQNAHFPGHPYHIASSDEEKEGVLGGYYPLLRRSLIKKDKTLYLSPESHALNIVSDYPEMAALPYEVTHFTKESITFEARQPHRKITKTFTLLDAPYCFELKLTIEGDRRGLWLTSGVNEVEIMSNSSSPEIFYRITKKQKPLIERLSLPKSGETLNVSALQPHWVANSNGYLGIILNPLQRRVEGFKARQISGEKIPTRLSLLGAPYFPHPAHKYPGYEVLISLASLNEPMRLRLYAGPFEEKTLKAVDKIFTDPSTGENPDYSAGRTFHGWFKFISAPFSKFLFVVLSFFHRLTYSWGFSIILLTVFLRILLYPLNAWSIKSMRRMQKIAPEIKAIQKRHKKDPKKAQMEIMALYRAKKVNPFTGCIPILIQLPFLIAMFDLLKSSFQLRGASFIPGWIDNLTAPDVLFEWSTPIFFIGNQFHLLPILLGLVMFIQQRLSISTSLAADSSELTDQQRQQRAMGTMMTVVFTIMFYHFPSGLNIYWLSSMTLGIIQQWITNKVLDKKMNNS